MKTKTRYARNSNGTVLRFESKASRQSALDRIKGLAPVSGTLAAITYRQAQQAKPNGGVPEALPITCGFTALPSVLLSLLSSRKAALDFKERDRSRMIFVASPAAAPEETCTMPEEPKVAGIVLLQGSASAILLLVGALAPGTIAGHRCNISMDIAREYDRSTATVQIIAD